MHALLQDLRHATRHLALHRAFALTVVLILAVAIGANTAFFGLVNAVLLRPLSFARPEQLVQVFSVSTGGDRYPFTLPSFCDYRDEARTVSIAGFATWSANLTGAGEAERVLGARVSANTFELLGVRAAAGRLLQQRDDAPGSQHVVVLGHGFWKRRFGGDPAAVGSSLLLNGVRHEVVGVLPRDFLFPFFAGSELAVPLAPEADPLRHVRSSVSYVRILARLAPGASRGRAEAELEGLAAALRQRFPVENANKLGVRVVDLRDGLVGEHRRALWMLFGAVALVLLIACADLAHLLLARAAGRRREMAIRAALGATRASLLRRLLLESLMLALAGGALGTLLAWWGQRLLLVLGAANLPRAAEAAIDGRALAFALAASLVCAILFGLAPAWAAADGVGGRTLRESVGVAGGAASGRRLRNALVSGEVALALVLLIGAGLFLRSLLRVLDVKPGFDVAHALIVRLALPPATYPDSPSVTRFSEEAERRVAALPGVQASGFINIPPMSGSDLSVEFTVVGTPPVAREQVPRTHYRVVTPGALGALGIPLVAGRGFDARDKRDATPVLLINRHLARRFFPQRDPIGQQLTLDDNDSGPRALEIAGVVGDVSQFGPDREPTFDVYLPLAQSHPDIVGLLRNGMHLVVRSAHDPRALAVPLKRALRSVDADVPATRSWTMEEALAGTVAPRRFNVWVLGGFAAAALVLAAAGIAAVVGYSVSQRRREIGIRLALGAPPRDVRRLVAAQSMRPALVGLGLGLSAALALTRVVGSLVFEVSPADPWTFAAAILLLAAVAFLACWLPAALAARVDPLIALRSE